MIRRETLIWAGLGLLTLLAPGAAGAQSSSLYQREAIPPGTPEIRLPDASWTHIPLPQPRVIEKWDIVKVRVDYMSRTQSKGEVQRRKNGLYDAVAKDWLRLGWLFLKPAAQQDGDPRLQGQLTQLYRAEGEVQSRESLALNVACTVVDIRPNGHLVLQGTQHVEVNQEIWEVAVSGICRPEDVGPDWTVLSRDVVDLQVEKRERGQVRDSYRRGWLTRWTDRHHPF